MSNSKSNASKQAAERAARKMEKKVREEQARKAPDRAAIALRQHNHNADVFLSPPLLGAVDRKYRSLIKDLCSQRLEQVSFVNALKHLEAQQGAWIRSPSEWQPTSHNARRSLGSLVRHLMCKYPTPSWLEGLYDNALYDKNMELYPHVAQGGNIKDFFATARHGTNGNHYPQLTKKQSHILLHTPERMPLVKATRRAQLLSFDGTVRQANAIGECFLGRDWQINEEFWGTVLQWLAANPFIAPDQIGPMMDYIRFCKNQRADFNMKGRTAARMFADMQVWHAGLQQARKIHRGSGVFAPSGFQETVYESISGGKPVKWCVIELLSQALLTKEGSALRHCVGSYGHMVASGSISIWSLRSGPAALIEKAGDGFQYDSLCTIEVINNRKDVVQVRGWSNAYPTVEQSRAISQWASQNSLNMVSR